MLAHARLLFGTSVFWLALSMVFDGINSLILPNHLLGQVDDASKATTLRLLPFGPTWLYRTSG